MTETKPETTKQPGELTERMLRREPVDQMVCAENIPSRVFEAARACAFAFPQFPRELVAERIASFYGYTDQEARRTFVSAIVHHLEERS